MRQNLSVRHPHTQTNEHHSVRDADSDNSTKAARDPGRGTAQRTNPNEQRGPPATDSPPRMAPTSGLTVRLVKAYPQTALSILLCRSIRGRSARMGPPVGPLTWTDPALCRTTQANSG